MKINFIVRHSNGSETNHGTVQEAFASGHALQQVAEVNVRTIKYPACFFEDEEGRRYGPVLRP